jgi:hypothetical protein
MSELASHASALTIEEMPNDEIREEAEVERLKGERHKEPVRRGRCIRFI